MTATAAKEVDTECCAPMHLVALYDNPETTALSVLYSDQGQTRRIDGVGLANLRALVAKTVAWVDQRLPEALSRLTHEKRHDCAHVLFRAYSQTESRLLERFMLIHHIVERRLEECRRVAEDATRTAPYLAECCPLCCGGSGVHSLAPPIAFAPGSRNRGGDSFGGERILVVPVNEYRKAVEDAGPPRPLDERAVVAKAGRDDIERITNAKGRAITVLVKAAAKESKEAKKENKAMDSRKKKRHHEVMDESADATEPIREKGKELEKRKEKEKDLIDESEWMVSGTSLTTIITPERAARTLKGMRCAKSTRPKSAAKSQSAPQWFNKRRLFHCHTLSPVTWQDIDCGCDSDEDSTLDWLHDHRTRAISSLTFASAAEREFFCSWNSFVFRKPVLSDADLYAAVAEFIGSARPRRLPLLGFVLHLLSIRLLTFKQCVDLMASLSRAMAASK